MTRVSTLPGGCKNLSDIVRIAALEGQQQWPPMTLFAAQKLASDQNAELIHVDTKLVPIFALFDEKMSNRLGDMDQLIDQLLSKE